MPFLIVLGCIILFFVAVLSIKVTISAEYNTQLFLSVKWLFVNIDILPYSKKEMKPKKEKKKKETPPKEEAPAAQEKPIKQKGTSPLKVFYDNKGVDGFVVLLEKASSALAGMFGKIIRKLIIEELFLDMSVTGGDAAETAVNYGKRCSQVFPALGYIISTMRTHSYNVNVYPDFLANKENLDFSCKIAIRPLVLTNAVVVLAFRLLFGVALKFLLGIRRHDKNNPGKKQSNKQPGEQQSDIQSGNQQADNQSAQQQPVVQSEIPPDNADSKVS